MRDLQARLGFLIILHLPGNIKCTPLIALDHFFRPPIRRKAAQSSMGSRPAMASFIAWISSGECPCQSKYSATTRSGSRERYDLVGLPGNFLSVRLGSSINEPVGSTR